MGKLSASEIHQAASAVLPCSVNVTKACVHKTVRLMLSIHLWPFSPRTDFSLYAMLCCSPQNARHLVRSPWAVRPPGRLCFKDTASERWLKLAHLSGKPVHSSGKATLSLLPSFPAETFHLLLGGRSEGARPKSCFPVSRSPLVPQRGGAGLWRCGRSAVPRGQVGARRPSPPSPGLVFLEKRAPIHVRRWQGRKGDKKRTTAENSPARLSAITTLSPACAWKEALPSAEENQLRKAKFEQRIPVISKHPMWQDISLSFRAQSFPPIHQSFTSAAELPGGLLSSQRRWLPPRSCCSSPFSPALCHCWVSARRDCARHAEKRAGCPSPGWPETVCVFVCVYAWRGEDAAQVKRSHRVGRQPAATLSESSPPSRSALPQLSWSVAEVAPCGDPLGFGILGCPKPGCPGNVSVVGYIVSGWKLELVLISSALLSYRESFASAIPQHPS